jgi:hypothetical protein
LKIDPFIITTVRIPTLAFCKTHFSIFKALCYKLEVMGSIPDEMIFSTYLILPDALGPGVYSTPNRNEYQKHKNNNVSGE